MDTGDMMTTYKYTTIPPFKFVLASKVKPGDLMRVWLRGPGRMVVLVVSVNCSTVGLSTHITFITSEACIIKRTWSAVDPVEVMECNA